MSNSLYRLYRADVMKLAETIVIKHHAVAVAINNGLSDAGYGGTHDPADLSSWKYYQNLAGEYHVSDRSRILAINIAAKLFSTDIDGNPIGLPPGVSADKMLVKRAGPSGPIYTNFELAYIDPDQGGDVAVANEYAYGTDYYRDLVAVYPDFEDLILGILYPTPTAIAIAAADGCILYCGGYYRRQLVDGRYAYTPRTDAGRSKQTLLESNESSLIEGLQRYVDSTYVRWYNGGYALVNDLYLASFIGNLAAHLPLAVMNHRLERCHTPEVHSYHVQEFLQSHGRLAKYIPSLPLPQSLFLYRNVRYLEKNMGKTSTFETLVEKLASPVKVPLSGYSLRHNVDDMPESLFPTPFAERSAINFRQVGTGDDVLTIRETLDKEIPLARENGRDLDIIESEMVHALTRTGRDKYPVKLIESEMLDDTDMRIFPLSSFIAHFWIFCASRGTFNGSVFATNPATGDRLQLTPLNALILAVYCFNRANTDNPLIDIPTIRVHNIPRGVGVIPHPLFAAKPTLAELKAVVTSNDISDSFLTTMLSGDPTYTFTSTTVFFQKALQFHERLEERYLSITQFGDPVARGEAEEAFHKLYWDNLPCELGAGVSYADWFTTNGVSVAEIEDSPDRKALYKQLAAELVRNGTGNVDDSSLRLRRLQEAVIEIMKQFSSYSVQYAYSMSTNPPIVSGFKPLRYRKPEAYGAGRITLPMSVVSPQDIHPVGVAPLLRIDMTSQVTLI